MKKSYQVILIITVQVLIFLILSIILFFNIAFKDSNTIIDKIYSPENKYIAYIFNRGINITTESTMQLSIKKAEKSLERTGDGSVSCGVICKEVL